MSSDPRQSPFAALGEAIAQHQALPPFEKSINRAAFGAGLLTWCGYAAVTFGHAALTFPPLVLAGAAAAACLGLLLLVTGVRDARGPRDIIMALTSILVPAGIAWVVSVFAGPGVFDNVLVRGVIYATVAAALVRVWLPLRGMPGDARKMMQQHIAENEVPWRSDRRKR